MFKAAFQNYTDVPLSLLGMMLFLVIFAGVLIYAMSNQNKQYFSEMAKLPLDAGKNTKELL